MDIWKEVERGWGRVGQKRYTRKSRMVERGPRDVGKLDWGISPLHAVATM